MKSSLQFKAVIFDMDGLMLDTERLVHEAFCYAAHKHGYPDTEDFFRNIIGRNIADADIAMKETFGVDFPIDAVRQTTALYLTEMRRAQGITLKPGLTDLLQYLQNRSIPLGVATSSSRSKAEDHLVQVGINHYFQTYVCGDEVIQGKPHPEIYLKTAQKLSKEPAACIVLEDSLPGVTAAYAAGMIPIMIPDIQQPTEEIKKITHRIFPSLHEVKVYLEEHHSI